MAHTALARLRGRGEPSEAILDRLLQLNPLFRVGWVPPGVVQADGAQRPAFWRIYEYQPNEHRALAGAAKLRRFERMSADKQQLNQGFVYDAEEALDGLHYVADFTEAEFGQDKMFHDLQEMEYNVREWKEMVRTGQAAQAEQEFLAELEVNSEFAAMVRDVAGDFYNRVKGNAVVSQYTPSSR